MNSESVLEGGEGDLILPIFGVSAFAAESTDDINVWCSVCRIVCLRRGDVIGMQRVFVHSFESVRTEISVRLVCLHRRYPLAADVGRQ